MKPPLKSTTYYLHVAGTKHVFGIIIDIQVNGLMWLIALCRGSDWAQSATMFYDLLSYSQRVSFKSAPRYSIKHKNHHSHNQTITITNVIIPHCRRRRRRSTSNDDTPLTCRKIATGVRQRFLLLEYRVGLHLIAGARNQIVHLRFERAVRHGNRSIRCQRIGQSQQLCLVLRQRTSVSCGTLVFVTSQ